MGQAVDLIELISTLMDSEQQELAALSTWLCKSSGHLEIYYAYDTQPDTHGLGWCILLGTLTSAVMSTRQGTSPGMDLSENYLY